MRYVVLVTKYAYGPFDSRREAEEWATANIGGLEYQVIQFIEVEHD